MHPVTREQIWRDQNASHSDPVIDLASVFQLEKPDTGDQCQPGSRSSLLKQDVQIIGHLKRLAPQHAAQISRAIARTRTKNRRSPLRNRRTSRIDCPEMRTDEPRSLISSPLSPLCLSCCRLSSSIRSRLACTIADDCRRSPPAQQAGNAVCPFLRGSPRPRFPALTRHPSGSRCGSSWYCRHRSESACRALSPLLLCLPDTAESVRLSTSC